MRVSLGRVIALLCHSRDSEFLTSFRTNTGTFAGFFLKFLLTGHRFCSRCLPGASQAWICAVWTDNVKWGMLEVTWVWCFHEQNILSRVSSQVVKHPSIKLFHSDPLLRYAFDLYGAYAACRRTTKKRWYFMLFKNKIKHVKARIVEQNILKISHNLIRNLYFQHPTLITNYRK